MREIPLTQGYVALVDDSDFEKVNAFKWCASKRRRNVYALRNVTLSDGRKTMELLHKFLRPGYSRLDHRDGNGLNNQRSNIRPVTARQNKQALQRKRAGASSRFRGVSWFSRDSIWVAQIRVNGDSTYLGRFTDETEAAKAYDTAAKQHFGEFASPNFKTI